MYNIKIKIKTDSKYKTINKLINNNIKYKNLYISENHLILTIENLDLKKIKELFNKKNIKIIKYYGKKKLLIFIKKHYIFILSLIISYLIILGLSNIIFNVNVIHESNDIKELINEELRENGIEKYKFKKNFKEIEKIKKIIIKNNKDLIEWMEIEENGTSYNIKISLRTKIKEDDDLTPRNIIASKDAMIKHITSTSGVILKNINDYVKKGEVIITGNIIKGEDELKGQVKAQGEVYGEVWYLITTNVPYEYKEYIKTGEEFNHYYLEFFGNKMSLINRYNVKNSMKEKKVVLNKFYLPFKIVRENTKVYKYKKVKLSKKQALNQAITRSLDKISSNLEKDEKILSKKVLKKEYFSSKIRIEVFIKVYENITDTSNI